MQAATQTTRHEATRIEITRGEGPAVLCGRTQTFDGPDCWAEANRWLFRQSTTFPRHGGYDKHDFVVTFDNGETYEGRLDCKHASCGGNDLNVASHVRGFQEFYAGVRRPAHMSPERYEEFMRHNAHAEEARDFLANYAVPGR